MDKSQIFSFILFDVAMSMNKRIENIPFGAIRDMILLCLEVAPITNEDNKYLLSQTICQGLIDKYNLDGVDIELAANLCATSVSKYRELINE